ncbi:MAG TPA: tol-pal system-associated acyl-CoA thioesterase [Stellaceae bacterium]|jgi:acyl-CoA thioester hydrolase|nr:tol-pal system-associated acyl-CoA thioesterase [Stellaceae bacterium]
MTAHLFNLRVYWEDTDAGGLVYHANYLKFAERARTEMLRHLGIEQDKLRADTGLMFVVRRLVAEFLQPARLDDELAVATQLKHLGGASLDLDQEVRRADNALVRLALRIACIGQDGRPSRLPDDIVNRFTPLNTH